MPFCLSEINTESVIVDVFFPLAVLLLAYMKGNANLCRAIVRAGARLGVNNNQGINIFNYQVATKQLLFRLLGKRYRFSVSKTFTVLVVISNYSFVSRFEWPRYAFQRAPVV